MDFDPETLDPRRAGLVRRYHTWPRINDQQVDGHSWQNIRILLAIWPDAPRRLLVYAMFHDVGEVATGDVPYPTKNLDPILQEKFDAAECEAHLAMHETFLVPKPVAISDFERLVFKTCEFIEMWEYGLHEQNLGNRYAGLVAERCLAGIIQRRDQIREFAADSEDGRETIFQRIISYVEKRRFYEMSINMNSPRGL